MGLSAAVVMCAGRIPDAIMLAPIALNMLISMVNAGILPEPNVLRGALNYQRLGELLRARLACQVVKTDRGWQKVCRNIPVASLVSKRMVKDCRWLFPQLSSCEHVYISLSLSLYLCLCLCVCVCVCANV